MDYGRGLEAWVGEAARIQYSDRALGSITWRTLNSS